jgi:hypothetical protein
MRLDDRLLGRWLYNRQPVPLRVEVVAAIATIVVVGLFAVLSGDYYLLILPVLTIASAWHRRTRRNRPPD